jgi:hypothetical protein
MTQEHFEAILEVMMARRPFEAFTAWLAPIRSGASMAGETEGPPAERHRSRSRFFSCVEEVSVSSTRDPSRLVHVADDVRAEASINDLTHI